MKEKKRKINGRKIAYWSLVSFLVLVIVVCVGAISYKLITDARDKAEYEDIQHLKDNVPTIATRPPIPSKPVEPADPSVGDVVPSTNPAQTAPTEPTEPVMFPEYEVVYNKNKDMVGWLEIPGTVISYPVVHTPDRPNFYLRKNFYGDYATCGTLYVRESCDVFEPSDNVTIYGHNMANGTMFADLHKYEKQEFWEENRYIHFDTLYEYHTYEIFAVFVSSADMSIGYPYHIFDVADSAEDYDAHIEKLLSLALYDTGIKPQYGEKIITLSTCDKSIDQGRLVVVARCID